MSDSENKDIEEGGENFEVVDEVKGDEDVKEKEENAEGEDGDDDGDDEDGEGKDGKKDKKKKGPWTARKVPNRAVLKTDRMHDQHQRTVMVGHATLEDLMTDLVQENINKCQQFFIRFGKTSEEILKGHLELRFGSIAEAKEIAEVLKERCREGISVQHLTEEILKSDNYKELTRLGENNCRSPGTFDNRTVAVSGIPEDITMEQLKEKFSETVGILLPMNDAGKNKGYAYLEYEKAEEAEKKVGEFVDFGDEKIKGKIYKVDPIPPLQKMLKLLEREKLDQPFMGGELDKNGKERITNLIRHVRHYISSDETPKQRKDTLTKWIPLLRRRLRSMKTKRGNQRGRGQGAGNKAGGDKKGTPAKQGNTPRRNQQQNQNNRNRNQNQGGRRGRSPSSGGGGRFGGNNRNMGGNMNRNRSQSGSGGNFRNRNMGGGGGGMWNRNNMGGPSPLMGGGGSGNFGGGNFGNGFGNSGNFGGGMGGGNYGGSNFGSSGGMGGSNFSDFSSMGNGNYNSGMGGMGDSFSSNNFSGMGNSFGGMDSNRGGGRFDDDFSSDRYGSNFSDRKRRMSDQGGASGFKRGNYGGDSFGSSYGSGNYGGGNRRY